MHAIRDGAFSVYKERKNGMAEWLRREDVRWPLQSSVKGHYYLKTFQNTDLQLLQDEANQFLSDAETQISNDWRGHLVSTQLEIHTALSEGPAPLTNPDYTAVTFTGDPKADKNKYLHYGQAQMNGDTGMVVGRPGIIDTITTNQDGTDTSAMDVLVNNVVVTTLNINARDHVFPVNIPVAAGDRLSARNQNIKTLKDFSMTLYTLGSPVPPPPPVPVLDTAYTYTLTFYVVGPEQPPPAPIPL